MPKSNLRHVSGISNSNLKQAKIFNSIGPQDLMELNNSTISDSDSEDYSELEEANKTDSLLVSAMMPGGGVT